MYLLIQRHSGGVYLDVVEEPPVDPWPDGFCIPIDDMAQMKRSGIGHCIDLSVGWIEHGLTAHPIDSRVAIGNVAWANWQFWPRPTQPGDCV
jgi:hypothetical protein